MALIPCRKCGQPVSDKADFCSCCGAPVNLASDVENKGSAFETVSPSNNNDTVECAIETTRKPRKTYKLIYVGIAIFLFVIIAMFYILLNMRYKIKVTEPADECDIVPVELISEHKESVVEVVSSVMGHDCVDLGLPSGIKWATHNVGASSPEEYGSYYAWGETNDKNEYSWDTYKWCNGSNDSMTKYCTNSDYGTVDNNTVLDPEDDVAHVKWGGSWRMPTAAELDELYCHCTWEWTRLNGVNGCEVTGPNGNSIFLPADGYRDGEYLLDWGDNGRYCGHYWSSSLVENYSSNNAFYLYFDNLSFDWYSNSRCYGKNVRPVSK